jgi:hypothetical protein
VLSLCGQYNLTFIKLLILKSGKDLTSGFAVGVG